MGKGVVLATVVLFFAVAATASEEEQTFQVGEKWVYKHEGPRPGGMSQESIDGDRTREVISVEGSGENKRWVIKETFGEYDDRPSRAYVDSKRLVTKREFGYEFSMDFDPPVPFDVQILKADEEKKYETELSFGENSIPFKVTSKRVANETIKVPAGEFKDCHHYQNTITIVFSREGDEVTIKTNQDIWYHPKVNGIVKDVYKRGPVQFGGETREGYTATSQLKSYSKEKKE